MLAGALEEPQKPADRLAFQLQLGALRFVKGELDKAEGVFRDIISEKPKHPMATNNLAAILADDPKRIDEAAEYVEKGLALTARFDPELADTKAMVMFQKGDFEEALTTLTEVVLTSEDPRHHFHMALCLSRTGKLDLARTFREEAVRLGLDSGGPLLTDKEKQLFADLGKRLL